MKLTKTQLSSMVHNVFSYHFDEETEIPHIPHVYAADYLHPNELGFTFMAQGAAHKLRSLLNR